MVQPAFQPPAGRRQALRQLGDVNASESIAPERLEAERFLKDYEAAYSALREDPAAFAEVEAEWSDLDGTLMDGLEDEPA